MLGRSPRSTSSSPRAFPSRVVVRRAGRELGRARVDRLVRALAGERARPASATSSDSSRRNHGSMLVRRCSSSIAVPRRSASSTWSNRSAPGCSSASSSSPWFVRGARSRVELARAQRLRERLLERPPDRHRLADRLHVGGQVGFGARELLEREPRPLDHAVVDRGLKARGRRLRDVVRDLLERVADREPRGDLRDREPGCLAGERARARHARVHLDHDDLVGGAVDRELHVGSAGLDADRADRGDRLISELLVLLVGERLLRRDAHAVAGVHAHRIEVLDRADDHDVVRSVAHHLELELAPPEHGLLEQHLGDRGGFQSATDDAARARLRLRTTPPPLPPSVNAGRTMNGRPTWSIAARASSIVWAIALRGTRNPARCIVSRKRSRSSARSIAS